MYCSPLFPLRSTVHLWVDMSRHDCDWARINYDVHRKKGQSHACALRCLGMRWLKILCAMLLNKTPYSGEFHARNQLQHGSLVLQLQPAKATSAKRKASKTAVGQLVLCKAFLAIAAVCLDSAARRCGLRLRFCVRKTCPALGTKQLSS